MSRGTSYLLFLMVGLAAAPLSFATPITINTVQDLQNINNNLSGDYVLGSDINAANVAFWPIGWGIGSFMGSLDGQGHTISNLTISANTRIGLFDTVGPSGTIQNIKLDNVDVSNIAPANVGAIAGVNSGTITGVSVSGTVSDQGTGYICNCGGEGYAEPGGIIRVGGIAGSNEGTIASSSSAVSVAGSGTDLAHLGGITGWNTGMIDQSTATGSVTGGLGGGDNASYTLGGLVGSNYGSITQSSATGTVDHTGSDSDGGGLVGYNNAVGTISQSFATGATQGPGELGGFVGWNQGGTIRNSYATGAVTGTTGRAAGLVDLNDVGGEISSSYSTGLVTNATGFTGGGLIQHVSNGSITNSYWDVQSSGQSSSAAGTGLSTADLQSGALPTGFDPTIWNATPGLYPSLTANPPPPYDLSGWYRYKRCTSRGYCARAASLDALEVMEDRL